MTQQLVPAAKSGDVPTEQAPGGSGSERWRHTPGLELMGPVQDSGLREDTFLIRRGDGQIVQISGLLNAVVREIRPDRSADQIAEHVSASYGKTLEADGLRYLVSKYLTALGLVEVVGADAPAAAPPRARTIMSLTLRGTLLPPRVVRPLATVLSPLFHPVAIALAVGAWLVLGVVLMSRGDLWQSFDELLQTPLLVLGLIGVLTACAIIHELGHATATTYGGAKPGRIGIGVYIVFLAYFTDVSDSYRLDRIGRVRVDLGGLYFNILTAVGLAVGYLLTESGFLLLVIFLLHIQMSQQLLPIGRFDGYYLIGDLTGVPDLFSRARPALASLIPGGDKKGVSDLKPWVRVVVVVWAVVVMPLLIFMLGLLVWSLPSIVVRTWAAGAVQAERLTDAVTRGDGAATVLAMLSMIMLILPVIGIVVILWRIASSLARWAWKALRPADTPAPPPVPQPARVSATLGTRRDAHEFTDELMLPLNPTEAKQPERAAILRLGRKRMEDTADDQRRRDQLLTKLRTPITDTRRVVVMSRKGGVGKTTMTMALGHTYATTRGDRVIAVDANPDAGNLAHRIAPPGRHTITDVLGDMDSITSYARLRSFTTQSAESQLEVLASDDDPRINSALRHEAYDQLIELLDRYYNLILLDTGTGILDNAHQGLLAQADQLVLVLRAGIDSGRAAALTLDWLEEHDYRHLVANALVVLNGVSNGVGAPPEPMLEHFSQRCAQVVTIPWDPELEVGGVTQMSALQPETVAAFEALSAAVAERFGEPNPPRGRARTVTPETIRT